MSNDLILAQNDAGMVPAFMNEHKALGREQVSSVAIALRTHLVQSTSPEAKSGDMRAGEFAVRPMETNLGSAFRAVVIRFDEVYIHWNPRKGKDGHDPKLPAIINRFTADACPVELREWGPNNEPPVATRTFVFTLLVIDAEGNFIEAPVLHSVDKHSIKFAGIPVVSAIKGWGGPICGQVFAFKSGDFSIEEGEWKVWKVCHARKVGVLGSEEMYRYAVEKTLIASSWGKNDVADSVVEE